MTGNSTLDGFFGRLIIVLFDLGVVFRFPVNENPYANIQIIGFISRNRTFSNALHYRPGNAALGLVEVPFKQPQDQWGKITPGWVLVAWDIDTGKPLWRCDVDTRPLLDGIAIGREGFGWTGQGVIARSARWPTWTPPPEMIARDPSLERWREGQPGGVNNPLGARALYIYFDGHDSGYRIHGTNHPGSIGYAASSGCFRMLNQDVIELQSRVQPGAHVVVM